MLNTMMGNEKKSFTNILIPFLRSCLQNLRKGIEILIKLFKFFIIVFNMMKLLVILFLIKLNVQIHIFRKNFYFQEVTRTIPYKRQVITICLWWYWKGLGSCRGKLFSGQWESLRLRNDCGIGAMCKNIKSRVSNLYLLSWKLMLGYISGLSLAYFDSSLC